MMNHECGVMNQAGMEGDIVRASRHRRHALCFMSFLLFLCFLAVPRQVHAQAEHVEVTHPVYDFLNRMQVHGLVPEYSRSMLPLERGAVTDMLRTAAREKAQLSRSEQAVFARFADEFIAEDDGTQDAVVIFETPPGDLPSALTSDREMYLYRWRSENGESRFAAELLASLDYRRLFDEDGSRDVTLGQFGGRFRGTLGGVLGFGLRATNGMVSGDRALAMEDRRLRSNFNFSYLEKDFFDLTEAYVSATWDWGNASLGKEKRIMGSGLSGQMLLSTNAKPMDALQFGLHIGKVRFQFLHGFILSEKQILPPLGQPWYAAKYVAMHRVEADILDALRFGVFESIIYSQREVDPAYLNPVNFYKSAEHAGGDRDNPMLGIDLATLFLPGWQLYGSWLLDDADFSRLGDAWWGNKFILQGGLLSTSLLPNTDIALEYTRIDPYVYTHRIPENVYTHDGEALGLEMSPNSDEFYGSLRYWVHGGLWVQLEYRQRRHGRNKLDDEGSIVDNNGADIHESLDYHRDSDIAPFLAGPRDNTRLLSLSLHWEPWRNFIIGTHYRFRDIQSETDGPRRDHLLSLDARIGM